MMDNGINKPIAPWYMMRLTRQIYKTNWRRRAK